MNERIVIKGEFNYKLIGILGFCYSAFFGALVAFAIKYGALLSESIWKLPFLLITLVVAVVFFCLLLFLLKQIKLTVTNYRVSGHWLLRHINIPIRQISFVDVRPLGGLIISSSAGRMGFWFLRNSYEVMEAISEQIAESR